MSDNTYSLSEEDLQDFNNLLENLLPFAKQMLETNGGFYPIGATVNGAGEVNLFAARPGEILPESDELIESLLESFREQTADMRAAAICKDVQVTRNSTEEQMDAIMASLERSSGACINVYLPYQQEEGGAFAYGEMFAGAARPQVFTR